MSDLFGYLRALSRARAFYGSRDDEVYASIGERIGLLIELSNPDVGPTRGLPSGIYPLHCGGGNHLPFHIPSHPISSPADGSVTITAILARPSRYNGPGAQQVNVRFNRDFNWVLPINHKYIVVIVDGRGTGFKGRKLRNPVKDNLGFFETRDQINAAK